MTAVTLASRRAAPTVRTVQTPARPATPLPRAHQAHQPQQATPARPATEGHLIQLHAQACNALHMALHHLTSPDCSPAMWAAATRRAHRGLTAIKQASALANQVGG